MSGRNPDAPIPPGFQCDYADPGEQACPAWRCDCFVDLYPDDPFGLHPEAFVVIRSKGYCRICGGRIEWLEPEQDMGGWWAHEFHPADGHDAQPLEVKE